MQMQRTAGLNHIVKEAIMKLINNTSFPLDETSSAKSAGILASIPCYLILGGGTLRTYLTNTLVPYLMASLNAADYIAIAMLIQSLATIIMLPVGGRIGDMLGRKKLVLAVQIPYIICVIACANAKTLPVFFATYFLLGLFNGVTGGCEVAMIMDLFSGKRRTSFLSMLSPVAAIFGFGGTYVASWIADRYSPQTGLLALAVVSALVLITTLLFYPNIEKERVSMKGFDWAGLGIMILFIMPLATVLSAGGKQIPWKSMTTLVLLVVSAVALFVFIKRESTYTKPIMNLGLFKVQNFVPTLLFALLISLLTGLNGYVNVYAAQVLEYPPSKTALMGFLGLINIILGPYVGRLINKNSKFKPTMWLSVVFFVIVDIISILMNPSFAFMMFAVRNMIGVCARTFGYVSWTALYGAILPADQRGIGVATDRLFTQVGTLINTAVLGFMMNSIEGGIGVSMKYMGILYLCYGVLAAFILKFMIKEPEAK